MTALSRRHAAARQLRELDPDRPAGRKTARTVVQRRKPYDMPDYTLSMVLPWDRSAKPGENFGITGLKIETIGRYCYAIVIGKSRDWVIGQGKALLRHMKIPRLEGVLKRAAEAGPTDSGPLRRGFERAIWIEAKGEQYLERDGGVIAMRTLAPTLFGD